MLAYEEVIAIISGGENTYVEFKETIGKANDFAGEIVAFANMEGGTIIIGVSDAGDVIGLGDEDELKNHCSYN